jgi:hypothetical protein
VNVPVAVIVFAMLCAPLGEARAQRAAASAAGQASKPESCSVDPLHVMKLATRRGYVSAGAASKGEAVCAIDEPNVILVVSATAKSDGTCDFRLFDPPQEKKLGVLRIGLKAGPHLNTKYVQRIDRASAIAVSLDAKKGETRQFRIVALEIEPTDDACTDAAIDGALR